MNAITRFVCIVLASMTALSNAQPEARPAGTLWMPSVFGDHMVLQRGGPVPVWGSAKAGRRVTVRFGEHERTTEAGADGSWRVDMPAMEASSEPAELVVESGGERLRYGDVLVGEVWLCSGQSNMEWSLWNSEGGQADIRAHKDDELRLMQVVRWSFDEMQDDVDGGWSRSEGKTLSDFSAVAYYMGMKLRAELGVPVGLIHSSFGGSPAQAWMPIDSLVSNPEFKPLVDRANKQWEDWQPTLNAWKKEAAKAEAEGREAPPEPQGPLGWRNGYKPGGLWNAMLRPLAPYRIAGAVWYQGESNVWLSVQYRELLPAMIADWREAWGQGDFPFGIVQLANYADPRFPADKWSWPEMREAQAMVAANDPNAGLVVTIDCGNPTDIHPRDKRTPGERLALWALHDVYGHDIVHSGPTYSHMEVEGDAIVLHFDNVGGGLTTSDGKPLTGFSVAANEEWWNWGTAEIVGDTVVVRGDWMPKLVAVRYAWSDNPTWANLCNEEGLPAVPFRTDEWREITRDNR